MGTSFLSGLILLGAPDLPGFSSSQCIGVGDDWTYKIFITPSLNSIVLHSKNPRSSSWVSGSTGVSEMCLGQGINGLAIAVVALGRFVSSLRAPHGDIMT